MLISETGRQLNVELHRDPHYATSGKLYVNAVARLAELVGTKDILDYGCGKRTLSQMLHIKDARYRIAEYDPAVSGVSDIPGTPVDVVACTDVLEHIEPVWIDDVLDHIASLTRRAVFFAVSCEPSSKTLADGRNAHLIQKPVDWWRERLDKRFTMLRVFGKPDGFVYIGQSLEDASNIADLAEIGPPPEVKKIQCKSAYTDTQRCDNIRSAMLRGLPSVRVLPAHDKTMVLACFGPSLKDTFDDLRREVAAGGDLYTTSGAHRFCIDRGLPPIAHIESDPRPHVAQKFGDPDGRVCYFVASAAAREIFDRLRGFETWLFHVTSTTAETELMAKLDNSGIFTLDAGTNVGMCGLALGSVLGYRRYSIHGMDCSFQADASLVNWPNNKDFPPNMRDKVKFHAGAHPNEDQPIYRVWCNGRPFITSPQMIQGAQDFVAMQTTNRGYYQFKLNGDGFLVNLMNEIGSRQRAA